MPEGTREPQDHPYVAHYDWPPDAAADDRFSVTPEKAATNAQHAADREAVYGGRGLRLVLAAPVIAWSFVGIPVLLLLGAMTILGILGWADVEITSRTIGLLIALVFIEGAAIWEALMLWRDQLSIGRWRAVLVLSALVAVAVSVALWLVGDGSSEAAAAAVIVWYCTALAVWQWRRSVLLASAIERLEKYSP
jgi:hypothetical protein